MFQENKTKGANTKYFNEILYLFQIFNMIKDQGRRYNEKTN